MLSPGMGKLIGMSKKFSVVTRILIRNLTGRKQAELLAQHLKDMKLDAIYSSPLERALRTAQIVAGQQHRLRLETDLDLVDFDYGEWQGVSEEDVKKKYAELYDRLAKRTFPCKSPGRRKFE